MGGVRCPSQGWRFSDDAAEGLADRARTRNHARVTWFERLTGVRETDGETVRRQFTLDGEWLESHANGRRLRHGTLELPSLAELRAHATPGHGSLRVREVVADVGALHTDPANASAFFQVASQFNLLEMVSPHVTPEHGIGCYENDHTQGPACAIAAGAGTIYRNYFVPVQGSQGQAADRQLDGLADLGNALGNDAGRLWRMQNGYALPTRDGLATVAARVRAADDRARDRWRELLRIGVHRDTEVTRLDCGHVVTQAYCSALPIACSRLPEADWEPFARLVLEAAYEATLCAAAEHAVRTGGRTCYLTLLGGGAFGNPMPWILDAATRALLLHRESDLDVAFVSYGASQPAVHELVARFATAK